MLLLPDDVRQILEAAIVAAKFAPPEQAGTFAAKLAGPVADGLNEVLSAEDQVPTETPMTISDALTLRDELAKVIGSASAGPISGGHANEVAERLLLANLIDVGGVWHRVSNAVATGLIRVQTGQHAAVQDPPYPARIPTGSTPAITP